MHIDCLTHHRIGGQAAGPVRSAVIAADNQSAEGAGFALLGLCLPLQILHSCNPVLDGLGDTAVRLDADIHHRPASLTDLLRHIFRICLLAPQGQQYHAKGVRVRAGCDESSAGPLKAIRKLTASRIDKRGRDITGSRDPLRRIVGALNQRDHHHLVPDPKGTVCPLIAHDRLRQAQLFLFVFMVDRVIHGIRCHGAIVSTLFPVDFLKVIVNIVLMYPVSLFDELGGHADMYTILDDLGSFFDISAGDFVPLFDIFVGRDLLTSH